MPGPCIAAIGASAGGFEAIRNFFRVMPADSGIAFVVVQHLDPTHPSLAAELFGKCTSMPVKEATDGALIEADHVYTSPAGQEMAIRDGRLCLAPHSDGRHLRLPIDHLFSSLGEDRGAKAIGIVLSGTGTDGTLGLKSIAAHGGIVVVQEPATAQFDGMPRSAIAAGVANHVLAVEQMPEILAGYARHPYAAGLAGTVDDDDDDARLTQRLIKIIRDRRGHDFSGYKRGMLRRRIQRRMGLRGILRGADYVALLKEDGAEADALFRDLLIGVTEFFRDAEAWSALDAEVIAPLVAARHREEPIRIWVPGCSTGEEAYTLAMVVLDRLRRSRKSCAVQIFATDTSKEALEVGRGGRYPIGIAARVPAALLQRYFVAGPDRQHFVVSADLRAAVVFGAQNLFADPPFGRVDLISCRNVLIYLEPEVQKRVLDIFHFALRKDACLFLGSAESNGGRDDLFRPISKKWRIYRREGSARADMPRLPLRTGDPPIGTAVAPVRGAPPLSQVAGIAQKLILDRFAPASVLVNASYEALYFCGPTDEFLVRPRGAPTQDLLLMVREGMRSRVRAALREAAAGGAAVSAAGARMRRARGYVAVQITVTPHPGGDLGPLFLVVFRHDPQASAIGVDKSAAGALVRQLEEELQATRDDLQHTIERHEMANENLKVSNEEVVSINEELRSLNEELESSKEELQSMNEEMTTVNQQLESKVRELEDSSNDLRNLLSSSDIATICLDRTFRVKWFTPATHVQFNFIDADVGRPVGDLAAALGDTGLVGDARAVLASETVKLHEFQTENGRWYIRRLLPYKTGADRVEGVIATYTDITDSHLAIAAAEATRRDLSISAERGDELRLLSGALALAEERERRALAQDLHDDLGQIIAVIKLKVVEISKLKLPAALRQAIDDCAQAIDRANRKVRAMAFQLNPPMLDQLGLVPALEWLADEIHQMHGLVVKSEDDGAPKPLDPAVSATLFRAIRELLINVAKHAGVQSATVTTARDADNMVVVTVSDAGAGFNTETVNGGNGARGYGLLSIRQRLGYLGGEVSIRSIPGDGTSVILKVPLLTSAAAATAPPEGAKP